jgi:peptidase C39-like protein/uncharacterized protein DUF1573
LGEHVVSRIVRARLGGSTKVRVFQALIVLSMLPFHEAVAQDDDAVGQMPLGRIDPEETERACGRRSLYVLLRLIGCQLDYKDLSRVPVNERGSSMADLVDAAKAWGCRLETKQGDLSSLVNAKLPLIAHIWLDRRQRSLGHYVVVVRQQAGRIYYVDATTGRNVLSSSLQQFNDAWSGYVIVPVNNMDFWLVFWTAINVLAVALAAFWLRAVHRLGRRSALAAAAFLGVLAPMGGCAPESRGVAPDSTAGPPSVANAKDSEKQGPRALATSVRFRDLGTVPPGTEAKAVFTLTNISTKPVELSLGQPTCGCVAMRLDDPVIAPGRSTCLSMILSSVAGTEAGPREASLQVGLVGSSEQYSFTVRGILEGLKVDPYTIKIPSKLEGFAPDPIEGEFIIEDATAKASAIKDVRLVEESGDGSLAGAFSVGTPRLGEETRMPQFKVRRFSIPVSLREHALPKSGSMRLRVSYQIGGVISEYSTPARVFPKAEVRSE